MMYGLQDRYFIVFMFNPVIQDIMSLRLALPDPARPCLALPDPVLPCPTLPDPVLPCPTLPDPVLPCPTLQGLLLLQNNMFGPVLLP